VGVGINAAVERVSDREAPREASELPKRGPETFADGPARISPAVPSSGRQRGRPSE